MAKARGRIIGFVDTFSQDAANRNFSFNGWAVVENDPADFLEYQVTIDGETLPVRVSRYCRPDLVQYPLMELGFSVVSVDAANVQISQVGSVKVFARRQNNSDRWQELTMGELAMEQIQRHIWLQQISRLNADQFRSAIADIFHKINSLFSTSIFSSDVPINLNEITKSSCTELFVPSGLRSLDGSCVLGGMGHAFLIGGTNSVLDGYKVDEGSSQIANHGNDWVELFHKRKLECDIRNIVYIQSIIPEKISVMPELFDKNIITPTELLSYIEDNLKKYDIFYVSGYNELKKENKYMYYDRVDTHLSSLGSFKIFSKILELIGFDLEINPTFFKSDKMVVGDVADRFFMNSPLLYQDIALSELPAPLSDENLELIEEFNPPEDGHIGTKRIFRNAFAPINKKVLVFGNSFFERGRHPKTLTWWFARCFSELHFIWQPQFDWGYVEKISPDIIVGQTIERFLTKVPAF